MHQSNILKLYVIKNILARMRRITHDKTKYVFVLRKNTIITGRGKKSLVVIIFSEPTTKKPYKNFVELIIFLCTP